MIAPNFTVLEDISAEMCGGKAKGLALLSDHGFLIPETLVVPYFADVIKNSKLINAFLNDLQNRYGAEIKLAVRSSAASEDGTEKSYAGMFETMLNVDCKNVLRAIEKVRNATISKRIIAYEGRAIKHNINVIVQRMVKAEVSGICFTVNPVNHKLNEGLIEIAIGYGDKVVSGAVNPQSYRINDTATEMIDFGDYTKSELLNKEQKEFFVNKIKYIKQNIYPNADIEFSIENDAIVFLQLRPITAVYG